MDFNRISATITKDDVEAVYAAINTINARLPFLIDLTPAERLVLVKMGDKSQTFVRKAIDVAVQTQ